MARKKSRPTFRSATTKPGANGTTAKESSTVIMITAGASTNTSLSAKGGTQSSLVKILTMSATTCRQAEGTDPVGSVAVLQERPAAGAPPDQRGGDE